MLVTLLTIQLVLRVSTHRARRLGVLLGKAYGVDYHRYFQNISEDLRRRPPTIRPSLQRYVISTNQGCTIAFLVFADLCVQTGW